MAIRRRLRSWLWRVPIEEEVREELALHVELRARELMDRGVPPAAARNEATHRLGDVARIEGELRRLAAARNRRWAVADWGLAFLQDVRFAFRQAARQPGFTVAVVLTLALGLGATTTIFSVVHAVILAPFPYGDPARVLTVHTTWRGRPTNTSAGNFHYLRQRTSALDPLAASAFRNMNLAEGHQPERVLALRTTWTYFHVFGVRPALGRVFAADDDQPGRHRVAVLSDGLWRRHFGGDAAVIGREIRLDGEPFEVVGVMPATFAAVARSVDLFVPIAFTPEQLALHDEHYLDLVARRRAGVTLAQ